MNKSKRNRTLTLTNQERQHFVPQLQKIQSAKSVEELQNQIFCQDFFELIDFLPDCFVDLLFVDPPYNLNKKFQGNSFQQKSLSSYLTWLEQWLPKVKRILKPTASLYICGDWRSSAAIHYLCAEHFVVRNRITMEREKGRAAKNNWKNNSEDIWFCTVSDDYFFDVEKVRIKRKVLAPYRENGKPKDWEHEAEGKFRLTAASNVFSDITIPFWSMSENTPHPTQKPEKLLARLILASSQPNDLILDPFAGSGTTGVVAKKLNRRFVLCELEQEYALFAAKRLFLAEHDKRIQGYQDGFFWHRNARL